MISMKKTAEAIRFYREYFHEYGLFQNVIYPGIPELLQDLTNSGKHWLSLLLNQPYMRNRFSSILRSIIFRKRFGRR